MKSRANWRSSLAFLHTGSAGELLGMAVSNILQILTEILNGTFQLWPFPLIFPTVPFKGPAESSSMNRSEGKNKNER